MVKRAYRLQVRRGSRRRVALLLARFETRRGSFVGTPASRARDHSPDPPPHALDRDPSLSSARPPPIANVVKRLETLGYRWAYRVVNLPGASPRDGNDRIGYRIGHRAF